MPSIRVLSFWRSGSAAWAEAASVILPSDSFADVKIPETSLVIDVMSGSFISGRFTSGSCGRRAVIFSVVSRAVFAAELAAAVVALAAELAALVAELAALVAALAA